MSWSASSTPTTTAPAPLPSMGSSLSSSSSSSTPAVRPPTTTFLLSPTTTSSPTYTHLRPLTPTLDLLHPSRVRPLSESLCLSPRRPPPLLSSSDIFSFNFLDADTSSLSSPSSSSSSSSSSSLSSSSTTTSTSLHLPLSPFQVPPHRQSQQPFYPSHQQVHPLHRFEPSIHSSVSTSFEYEREIQALELWFMDLNDSIKSKTLYTLVQHISPEQARFFTMVLSTIAKREEQAFSAANGVDTALKSRPFHEQNIPTRATPAVPWHLDLSLPKKALFRPQSPAPIGASRPSSPLNPSMQISTGQSFFSPSPSPPLSTTSSPPVPPSSPATLTPKPPSLSLPLNSTPSYIASPSPSPSTRFIPHYPDHRFKKYNTTPRPPPRSWKDPIDFALLKDIPAWLRSLRLHKYTALFHPHYTWQQMIDLTDEDLTKLGVSALGARNKFLKVFQQIKLTLEESKEAASSVPKSSSSSSTTTATTSSVNDKPSTTITNEPKAVTVSS